MLRAMILFLISLVSIILLGIGTVNVLQAADAMTKLESVSGNTVAEAYYQAVGLALKGALFLCGAGLLIYTARLIWEIWRENR